MLLTVIELNHTILQANAMFLFSIIITFRVYDVHVYARVCVRIAAAGLLFQQTLKLFSV